MKIKTSFLCSDHHDDILVNTLINPCGCHHWSFILLPVLHWSFILSWLRALPLLFLLSLVWGADSSSLTDAEFTLALVIILQCILASFSGRCDHCCCFTVLSHTGAWYLPHVLMLSFLFQTDFVSHDVANIIWYSWLFFFAHLDVIFPQRTYFPLADSVFHRFISGSCF